MQTHVRFTEEIHEQSDEFRKLKELNRTPHHPPPPQKIIIIIKIKSGHN